ncbi:hypothetical protein ABTA69_20795, partial [Acinetobacter baumannii]
VVNPAGNRKRVECRGCPEQEEVMIFKSPHPEVSLPDISLAELILQNTSRLGTKPAFIDGLTGRTITYQQIGDSIRSMAAAL